MIIPIRLFVIAIASCIAASTAYAGGERIVMDDANTGHIIYADHCSNGANNDAAGFKRFVDLVRANPKSLLARTLADAETKYVIPLDKTHDELEIVLGPWIETYHNRDGCSDMLHSYSAFVFVQTKTSNIDGVWARYLVTIDDDVAGELRTLHVRSALALQAEGRQHPFQ